MNSFELNKVMGAVLGACLVLLALNITSGAIFAPHKPEKPGFAIAVQEDHGGKEEAKRQYMKYGEKPPMQPTTRAPRL